MNKNVEIVVAHYCEDMERLKPYAKNAIVYHKWNEDKPRFPVKKRVKLENVWREWETYLQHIIQNYDNLADITIFLQWWMKDQLEGKVAYKNLESYISEANKYGFSNRRMSFLIRKTPQIKFKKKFKEWYNNWSIRHSKHSFSSFYEEIFGEKQPLILPCFFCANFAATRKTITNNPKKLYENIHNYFIDCSNPEEWHYLERLWFRIFNKKLKFHFLLKIIIDPIVSAINLLWRIFK